MADTNLDAILAAWRSRRKNSPLANNSHCIQSVRLYANSDVLILGAHFAAPTAGYVVEAGNTWQFDIRRSLR